jgi:hypothetical protein
MPGPVPTYQPTFAAEELAQCQRVVRQHSAPQAQVYRAKLALLLHAEPALDNVTAGRQLGKQEHWVRSWRRTWVREGFRLTDQPGRGRKPTFPLYRRRPSPTSDCEMDHLGTLRGWIERPAPPRRWRSAPGPVS